MDLYRSHSKEVVNAVDTVESEVGPLGDLHESEWVPDSTFSVSPWFYASKADSEELGLMLFSACTLKREELNKYYFSWIHGFVQDDLRPGTTSFGNWNPSLYVKRGQMVFLQGPPLFFSGLLTKLIVRREQVPSEFGVFKFPLRSYNSKASRRDSKAEKMDGQDYPAKVVDSLYPAI